MQSRKELQQKTNMLILTDNSVRLWKPGPKSSRCNVTPHLLHIGPRPQYSRERLASTEVSQRGLLNNHGVR